MANATRLLSYYDISRFDDSRVGILSDVAIPFGYVDSSHLLARSHDAKLL